MSKNLIFIFVLVSMLSSQYSDAQIKLKTGDILFRGKSLSGLSSAIDDVTQTGEGHHFSHVGMALVDSGQVFVLHSEGERGVCKEPLDSFAINDSGNRLYVEAYRLKPGSRDFIDSAVVRIQSVMGEPYNYTYVLKDKGYYCSELIYWAFEPDSVFKLNPMTFKDHETGKFHPGWVKYYGKLGIEIPEGLPGCNPNGMAASPNLILLGEIDD